MMPSADLDRLVTNLTLAPVEANIDIPTIGGGLTLDVDLGELGEDLGKMNMVRNRRVINV